jgi:hypothetical protein
MADEFLLWLWQGITSDLIQQGVDTNELHRVIDGDYGINRYSSKECSNDRKSTNGSSGGG